MQLCPTVASTLRGEPCLPSRACKYSSGLTGSAYRACGEAASALHAMALLQVLQAKALRDLHEGGHDLAVLHELRAATDLALRATKVTAQSLGRAMSTLVVQERHLWLCLTDMKEQEKVQFLNAPVSQTGLFGDAVESCAQQFSAAQKQTEAIKHIMRRRKPAAASTPAAAPQPARRRGRPPVAAPAPTPRQQPSTVRRRGAGHRQDAQPVQAPARPGGKRKCKRPWDGRPRDGENCSSGDGDRTTPSPGGGPGGESFVSFCFCSAVGPAASGTQNFNKGAVSSVSGSQEEESGVPCITGSLPSSSPKSTPPAHLWNRVRAVALKPPLQVVTRKPGSCVSSHTRRNQVSVTLHTQTPPPAITGQAFTGPGPGPCVPHRCPTTGTSVAPLVPLARSLGAWLALPSPSRWLLRTIRLGYAIQFARRPPKFRGIRFTSVKPADAPVLRAEIAVLLAKDAIEPVPPADMRSGLFSPYFIVPKKGGGLRPILDLRVLNRALHKLPFKMLTQKRIFGCVRPLDWFAAIDLKDAYFHVSILPRHRPFLRFAFEGQAYQYKVLPFGLSLSPRVFTKVVEAALVPLREQGVRILNYLDDWLILAQSRRQLSAHRDLVLKHLSLLGLRVNWEKSKLVPTQRISFLGMEFDSVNQTARLTQERAQSVLNCFKTLSGRMAVPLKLFQRLLGHMAAAAVTVPLGLLHMRPLQHWLYGRIPRWAWKRGTYRVQITPACRKTFRPWSDPSFLRAGVPLEQVSRHAVVFTDASSTGWGATYNGHAVSGVWTGPQLHWHINCLELLAVRLALSRLRGRLQRKDVLVRTDNTATVAYINRQGGLRSRRMSQLARHLLLWSQKHLRSLRAIHIPGVFNRAADELSRAALPGEWRLHPQAVQLIWGRFGAAQVDLFASPETTHCQEFYSLTEATLGTDALAHSWPRGLRKYAFPPVSLLAQTLCKIREDEEQVLLVAPYWPNRTWFPELSAPRDSPSLANSSEEGSAFSETGHPMAPAPGPVETPRMVPGWDAEVLADLPQEVALTITSARAPSSRRAYTLKWNLFVEWCSSHQEDPRRCSIRAVLSFLQQGLERRLSPSTLKVYVAAISAYHDPVEGKSVGKHNLVVRFLRGARRLNPPRPPSLPSWDLALVLRALITAPFEPLQSVELKFLSMKTLLLTALASIKRVGDLQAFSVDDSCLQFGPADSSATLRPRPGYVPKVPTTPFRDQVVNLQALPPEEADPALALLCPVRALRQYTDRTQSFRTSEQLFVCYGGQQKGKAVSKQRMAHWIVDAITLAYEAQGVPCPLRLRAHSTRGVASSWALARGASLADICRAAGWATPNTFARFYSLRVEPVSSCVLTSNG